MARASSTLPENENGVTVSIGWNSSGWRKGTELGASMGRAF
jgi:hypothetical protein